ncbi:complement C1q tumor necrosis factor-related protein 5-like [Pecten maximus]|uniref:complement C1q tumor necrosis factor-related protein 5-like n=1 Tax=Pecten maximus TaxID=6579 RepID=UPI001458CC05|nr:complement C1q tumor necrosis factor-related protein 5-like [Pecten maximus]
MTGHLHIWTLLCLPGLLGQLLPKERDHQVVKIQQALLESVRTPILSLTESIVQNQLDQCNATVSLLETKIREIEMRFAELETRKKDIKIAFYTFISFETAADILIFDRVVLNEGDAYNNSTGVFTCPVNGTYKFTWSVQIQNTDWGHVLVDFKLNGSTKGFTITFGPKEHTSTNTVILRLKGGDRIWLQKRSVTHIRIAAYETSFAGHFLYD